MTRRRERRRSGEAVMTRGGERRRSGEALVTRRHERRRAGEAVVTRRRERRRSGKPVVTRRHEPRRSGEAVVTRREFRHSGEPVATRDERGSGTVLVTAAVAVVLLLGIAGLHVGAAASAAHRARSAADLSALAAASALQEGKSDPCGRALALSGRNSARLVDCRLGPDDSVLVRVTTDLDLTWPGLPRTATASARAGPADARSP